MGWSLEKADPYAGSIGGNRWWLTAERRAITEYKERKSGVRTLAQASTLRSSGGSQRELLSEVYFYSCT